jgi:hypothetical protein
MGRFVFKLPDVGEGIAEARRGEEFRHHVARQPPRRAVHGLRGLWQAAVASR